MYSARSGNKQVIKHFNQKATCQIRCELLSKF